MDVFPRASFAVLDKAGRSPLLIGAEVRGNTMLGTRLAVTTEAI